MEDMLDEMLDDMEDDEPIPYISGSGEGLMDEGQGSHASARRNEDIALDRGLSLQPLPGRKGTCPHSSGRTSPFAQVYRKDTLLQKLAAAPRERSLLPQCGHRVKPGGAARGQVCGDPSSGAQEQSRDRQRRGVIRFDAIEQARDQAPGGQRGGQS